MGGAQFCCCGRITQFRNTLPKEGEEACRFRIPDNDGLLTSSRFVAYDGYATEKTAWLALTSTGRLATQAGQLFLAPFVSEGAQRPLLTIEVGAWNVRKLSASEASWRSRQWPAESYGNQFAWEAWRMLDAYIVQNACHGGQADDNAEERTALLDDPPRRPCAQLRVSHFGFGGSTNTSQMAEVFTGDADLETEARIKEYGCTLQFDGSQADVAWEADTDAKLLKFSSESPRFLVVYENNEVSIDTAANTNSLLACALGFATAKWASPWVAEEVADEKAEDFVRKELQDAIALSLSLH